MACISSLLTRIFHFRPRYIAPSSSTHCGRTDGSLKNSSITSTSTVLPSCGLDLDLWVAMAGDGRLPALVIKDLPHHVNMHLLNQQFNQLEGFIQIKLVETGQPTATAFIDFATTADAATALLFRDAIVVDGQAYTIDYADSDPDTPSESRQTDTPPPRQRQKSYSKIESRLKCMICTEFIEGPHSEPCRRCKQIWCFECVKAMFVGATNDKEKMPAKCCSRVIHYGVAGGIVDEVDLEIYKTKYEEFCTSNPLYCPVNTCSAFIPPRMMHPVEDITSCLACSTTICVKCKQIADSNHRCAPVDADVAKIKSFNYKLCPKCGNGVMKMYGCPHMCCVVCGAHWCYDCRRPMNACFKRPCRSARDEGASGPEESDEDSDSEDGLKDVDSAATLFSVPQWPINLGATEPEALDNSIDPALEQNGTARAAAAASVASSQTEPSEVQQQEQRQESVVTVEDDNINLDDPEANDWEGENLDFGDEPDHESWDVWGCAHFFTELKTDVIKECWIQDTEKYLDCMRCFKMVKLFEKEPADGAKGMKGKDKVARNSEAPVEVVEAVEADKVEENVKVEEERQKASMAFDCSHCGVVWCGDCKEEARLREKRDARAMRNAAREPVER